MTQFLLSESAVSFTQLAIEYIVYAAIIVIGILLLFALRRCGRLPKHAELAKKLTDFESDLRAFQSNDKHLSGYRYFRNISKLIKRADKLLFYSAQMADRERDSDLGSASLLVENVRELLQPLRYDRDAEQNSFAVSDAADKVHAAAETVNDILKRDAQLKAKRAKNKKQS